METKINKTYTLSFLFSLLLLCCGIYQGRAQEPYTYGKRIVLERNDNYFYGTFVARDLVSMRDGFKCTSFQSFFRATLDQFLIVQKDDYEIPFTSGDITINTDLPVGKIEGSANVGQDGSANYNISIPLPLGTMGVEPKLAISYNSFAGNGILGMGWNFTGLSVITRVPKTLFKNGRNGGINFDLNDRLALDGVRLNENDILHSYWENGSHYRTEVETYSNIALYYDNGIPWFKVNMPDGSKVFYGNTSESRLSDPNNPQKVLIWYVTRMEDKNGNYVRFNYRNIGAEVIIENIEYTGNDNTSPKLDPYNKVQFFYEKKTEECFSFVGGAKFYNNAILRKIQIINENKIKGEYQFVYSFDNNLFVSKLKEIKYVINNITQINSTKILWKTDYTNNFQSVQINHEIVSGISRTAVGDFDGDGKSEIFKLNGHIEEWGSVHMFLSDSWTLFRYNGTDFVSCGSGSIVGMPCPVAGAVQNMALKTGDYNRDGKADVIINYLRNVDTHITFSCNAIYGFNENNNFVQLCNPLEVQHTSGIEVIANVYADTKCLADFNGDGRPDFYELRKTSLNSVKENTVFLQGPNGTTTTISFPIHDFYFPQKFQVINYDGDNYADVLFWDGTTTFVYEYQDIDGTFHKLFQQTDQGNNFDKAYFGDFNADGKTDYMFKNNANQHQINYSKCAGSPAWEFNTPTLPNIYYTQYSDDRLIRDFNGDGFDDILINWGNSLTVYLMEANHAKELTIPLNFSLEDDYPITSADFNGDGMIDIFGYNSNFDPVMIFADKPEMTKYVDKIYDGYKNCVQYTYQPLTSGAPLYYKYTSTNNPNIINIQPDLYVVSKMEGWDKDDNKIKDIAYTYLGMKYHITDNRLLGFSQFIVEDKINSIQNITYKDAPTINNSLDQFFITKTIDQALTNHYINVKTTDYEHSEKQLDEGWDGKTLTDLNRVLCWVSKTTEKDYLNNTVTITDYDPDVANVPGFGGLRAEVRTISRYDGLNSTTPISTNTETYGYYFPSFCNWYKSFLWRVKKEITSAGQTATGWETYGYDDITDNVTSHYSYCDPLKKNWVFYKEYNLLGQCLKTESSADALGFIKVNKTEYDAKGRVVKTTNPLDQFSLFEYNSMGQIIKNTDINNLTTVYEYDELNRLKRTHFPDGNYIEKTANFDLVSGGKLYRTTITSSTDPVTISYFDCQDRCLLTQSTNMFNQIVYSEINYNYKGQIVRKSIPYYSGSALYTNYTYDYLGRQKTATLPDGSSVIITHSDNSERLVTVVSSKNGHTKTSTTKLNALGLTEWTTDNINNKTSFVYNAAGLNTEISINGLPPTRMEFSAEGMQTKLIDLDAGTTLYVYNNDGTLKEQTDAKNIKTQYTYDKLGRVLTKMVGNDITTYTYDNRPYGKGKLGSITSINNGVENFYYDNLSRLIKTSTQYDGETFDYLYSFNNQGKLNSKQYPGGFGITYNYQNGYLNQINDISNGNPIWIAKDQDNTGAITEFEFGDNNRTKTILTYEAATHYLTEINTGNHTKQWWQYEYDYYGNMTKRCDKRVLNKYETFTYDGLDRLASVSGPVSQNLSYFADGRINLKSSIGFYNYEDPLHLHAVTKITNGPLVYNAPPNHTINYTNFDKVSSITQENKELDILYGIDKQRIKSIYYENDAVSKTKYFIGNYEKEINHTTNIVKEINYVNSPSGLIAVNIKLGTAPSCTYYVCKDHQGSITAILNKDGNIAEEYSYDAWGRRRNPTTWEYSNMTTPALLDRGYTGHEHLDQFGLINMNGRVYDPALGRMLSPDNYIQAAGNSQNYDRYAYCLNNPLKYTDPSGEIITWSINKDGLSIGVNFCPYPIGAGLNVGWGDGFSLGGYVEVGERVGGTGLGAGIFVSESLDYNFKYKDWSATTTEGVYVSFAIFTVGVSFSQSYDITNNKWNRTWGVYAGLGTGTDEKGLAITVGYGSNGWSWGIGGYYDPSAWEYNPVYEPDAWNDGGEVQSASNCYNYAWDDPDNPMGRTMNPGEYSGTPLTDFSNLEDVTNASLGDGLKKPTFFNKLGYHEKGYYEVYLVVDNEGAVKDYHWYRKDKGGYWSQKHGKMEVTNIDGSGHLILNPSRANHNYSFTQNGVFYDLNYKNGGTYLWVKKR